MGTKYSTNPITGYNSSPPTDDGTASEANKVKWATHIGKIGDPLKDQVANIDADLVTLGDIGPDAVAANYTTVAGDHQKTLEVTAASVTITLLAVASAPDGYTITVKNSSGSTTDIDATGSETIDGSTGSIMLADDEILVVQLNQGGTGYIVLQQPDSTIISSAQVYKGTAAGTADAITVALTPTLSALTDGTVCFVKALLANATPTPTLSPDGLTAHTITKEGSQALVADDIARVDHELIFRYNSANTEWELLNPATVDESAIVNLAISQDEIDTTSLKPIVQTVYTEATAVATGTTTIPVDDSIPQNTEGNEYITLAITPSDTSNKLLIEVSIYLASSSTGNVIASLFQDSTASAIKTGTVNESAANSVEHITLRHYMDAGTTSTTAFKVRAGSNVAGTTTLNGAAGVRYMGGTLVASISITEIMV